MYIENVITTRTPTTITLVALGDSFRSWQKSRASEATVYPSRICSVLHYLQSSLQRRRQVWRFRGGPGEFVVRWLSSHHPHPHPLYEKKFSPDFHVFYGPHWASQGGPDPWTPRPATPLRPCLQCVKIAFISLRVGLRLNIECPLVDSISPHFSSNKIGIA